MRNGKKPASLVSLLVALLVAAAGYFYSQGGSDTIADLIPAANPTVTEVPGSLGEPGLFDYYILSLSWSPEYCASNSSEDPATMQYREKARICAAWTVARV